MKFPPVVALILSLVLAAAEAVQLQITMGTNAHDAITVIVTLLVGLGVIVASPSQIVKLVPHWALVILVAIGSALTIVEGSWSLSTFWHTLIAVVIVIITAVFSPAESVEPIPAPTPAS